MDKYPSEIPVEWLLPLATHLEPVPNGSGSSHFGGPEGWITGLAMRRLYGAGAVGEALAELESLTQRHRLVQVMVNRLAPGGRLAPHRDGYPDNLRYHLPLKTNSAAYWWDEYNGRVHMECGTWYGPVPYCGVLHSAVNDGDSERIHLIADYARN